MQSNNKVDYSQFSLVIIKNNELLDSVRDYFYQRLLHDFDDEYVYQTELNDIDNCLNQNVKTKYAVVIQEGILFFQHIDYNFLKEVAKDIDQYSLIGHLLDRKERYYHLHQQHFILNMEHWKQCKQPSFLHRQESELADIDRSDENFHDDYTPVWIKKLGSNTTSCDKLKFGGYVISEILKNNFKVRPFNHRERNAKRFCYYETYEQLNGVFNFDPIHPYSYYYPKDTSHRIKEFNKEYTNYISVANGIESLKRIKNVYQNINSITFYDMSITALIFTELLIKNFKGNYKEFVQDFDDAGAGKWNFIDQDYNLLNEYETDSVLPILEHIRNNDVQVKYFFGDITRTSILENVSTNTLINLSNVFNWSYNTIRKDEWTYWLDKVKNHQADIQWLL
jgi:hypothetical protein